MITQPIFQRIQTSFYKRVVDSPRSATLRIYTVTDTVGSFDDYLGTSETTYKEYTLPVFDAYTLDPHERQLFGLGLTQAAAIYFSPLQLINIWGSYAIDVNKTVVVLDNHEYLVSYVDYLGSIYSSCIAVKLSLKEYIRG